jgi:hypothetical protein
MTNETTHLLSEIIKRTIDVLRETDPYRREMKIHTLAAEVSEFNRIAREAETAVTRKH